MTCCFSTSTGTVLQTSAPITTAANGQVIENKVIHAIGSTNAILVNGHQNVIIRNCKIYHAQAAGIRATGNFSGLLIEDCWIVCSAAPAAGPNQYDYMNNIDLYGDGTNPTGVILRRVRMEKGSNGIYSRFTPGIQCLFMEVYDVRGPFPRGCAVQFHRCVTPLLQDFSAECIGNVSWPEDTISCFECTNPTISRGFLKSNNASNGVGGVDIQNDTFGYGGTVTDVDAVFYKNVAFLAGPGSSGVVFTRCRARDQICPSAISLNVGSTAYDGSTIPTSETYEGAIYRGSPSSGGLTFGTYLPAANNIQYVDCYYYNRATDIYHLAYDLNNMSVQQFTQQNFTPRSPIRNAFNWVEP